MKVNIVNKSKNPLPKYETAYSAGLDVKCDLNLQSSNGRVIDEGNNKKLVIDPGERVMVHTGLYMEIPIGYECQVRPRSGLALKKGISIVNSPGTIDSKLK